MHTLNKQLAFLLLSVFLITTTGCKKDKDEDGGGVTPTPDHVYVAGMYNRTVCYWKDNDSTYTLLQESQRGCANAMYVSGTDVYVAGYLSGPAYQPSYWKNGSRTALPTITGSGDGYANGIQVVGSDVYVSGYTVSANGDVPCYWKNGVRTDLTRLQSGKPGRAYGLMVLGSNIYLAGYTTDALDAKKPCYWKNDERIDLVSGNREYGEARAIYVSDKAVYVAGFTKKNTDVAEVPCYWKDKSYVALNRVNNDYRGYALGVCVAGADVYIAGFTEGVDQTVPCYWKNGSRTDLSTVSPRVRGEANAVQVSGDGIYVAGTTYADVDAGVPCYWKNGNRVDLIKPNTFAGVATSIFVTK